MTTGPGPDSPWVFVIVILMLALVVIVDKRREDRRRERLLRAGMPPCQAIGCDPRPSYRWMPKEGIYACARCADEIDALRPTWFRGSGAA